MKRDPIPSKVLASKLIPNVAPDLAKQLGLNETQKSIALITTDCDDVGYTAVDEGRCAGCIRQELLRRCGQCQHKACR